MDPAWDDLKTALALVRAGSLTGAAEALGVTYTTVARRITRLEAALGQTLFERLADGYRPTPRAQLIAEKTEQMEQAQNDLMRQLAAQSGDVTGQLTLTAPQLFIAYVIAPALREFRETWPEVDLHVRATNELLDLNRRQADVALRISRSPGDSLKGLKLTEQMTASFATPDWAERIARDPVGEIDWVLYSGTPGLPRRVSAHWPGARVRYRLDDMIAIGGAVQAGLGVARLPMFLGRALPGVVQVPCLPPEPYADVWLLSHPDVWEDARVTALKNVLVPFMRARRAEFVA